MAENSPSVYFAKSKLLKVAGLFIQCLDINGETKELLGKILWEQASSGSSDTTWTQAWTSLKLLHILQQLNVGDKLSDLDETFISSRKEIFFTSLVEALQLSSEACKELKVIFSKVLFANLISKGKILPKLNSATEAALLNSLLDELGKTHILLELISCDHEAFFEINKAIKNLYKSAVTRCLNSLTDSDMQSKKQLLNLLYALLLLIKHDDEFEDIGESLYHLCQIEVLDFFSILTILGCRQDSHLYNHLKDCESKRMLRKVDCSNVTDPEVIGCVYNKIISNGQISFEEMSLRVISLKCHWVEELVRMATHFVVAQDQEKLAAVVCFTALWPAIAVSLWKQFSSKLNVLDIVLPVIESCESVYPEMFGQLLETVRRMKIVTDWLRSEGVSSLPDVNVMLSLTRNHSTLHVLQSTTHFVGLDHSNLLQMLLKLEGADSWNVRVFEGFALIFTMFQTIMKAVDYFNEAEKDENQTQLINLKYKEEITNTIMEIGEKLNKIEPLDFRLELLEDIFLLLFLRSEDYCENKGGDDCSPDENEDVFAQQVRCVSDSADAAMLGVGGGMPASWPSPSHRRPSPSRSSTASSYPSYSQRKTSTHSKRTSKPFRSKYSQGFVCYPWLVSDTLSCVKRSLEYMETTCDITGCDRYFRLKKSVEDASWKFNMVREKGSKDLNIVSLKKSKIEERWVYVEEESSDSDTPSPATVPLPSPSTRRSRRGGSTSRSESGSNITSGRRLSSSASSVRSKKSSQLFSTSSNIINLMLASPASLVAYFIIKEDLDKASKCVEKFSMKGQPMDVELNFLKEFSTLRKRLAELQVKSVSASSSVKDIALQVISETASSGVLTVTLTKLFETFFAMTSLPIEVGDSKGMVVLDVALSLSAPPQHSTCLLDLAGNYFGSGTSSHVLGKLKAFTTCLRAVMQESDDSSPLGDLLVDPSVPLRPTPTLGSLRQVWASVSEGLASLQTALASGDDDLADAAYLRLTTSAITVQEMVQNYQDDTKQHFLNHLRFYLACLWKVVAQSLSSSKGTKYHILDHNLDDLIGDLVFTKGKDPMDIEAALKPLSVNVVHLVVAGCTPSITITQVTPTPARVVLNGDHCGEEEDSECQPDLVAYLLGALLDCVDTTTAGATSDTGTVLAACADVRRVLAATARLRSLDWTSLSPGDQVFTLLVNLYNLMWLHAVITLELAGSYCLISQSASLRELTAARVGYVVGKDCFVSLAQLRSMIVPLPVSGVAARVPHSPVPVATSSDPRALFLLASPYKLSPALQVLPSRDMDREIDSRMSAFIEASVRTVDGCLVVPAILQHYIDYITLTQGTESEFSLDNVSNSSREHVGDFLKDFLKFEDISGKDIIISKEIGLTITKKYSSETVVTKSFKHSSNDSWNTKDTRPEILKYLAARNPLLGLVVEKIHCIESAVESVKSPAITTPLERQLLNPGITSLASMYDNNIMLVTLKSTLDMERLWLWMDAMAQQQDWTTCLESLSFIPEKQFKSDSRFADFRCWVLEQLCCGRDGWRYCQNIADPVRMYELVLANKGKWSLEGTMTVLQVLLSMDASSLPLADVTRAKQLETSVQTTNSVRKACSLSSMDDAWAVLEELLNSHQVHLGLQWFKHSDLMHTDHSSHSLLLIGQLILELLETGEDAEAESLLKQLPSDRAVRIAEGLVSRAQSVSSLQHLVAFLQQQGGTVAQTLRYHYLHLGVIMLTHIPWQIQESYRTLVSQPELLVEQLLMSTRISTLEAILHSLHKEISSLPPGSPLSPPCLDALLRRYAAKAVDVRVRTKILPSRRQHTPEMTAKFTPPDIPPTKEEWVGNDEVTECMCCQVTVFSMFNRRHHCRRCGRVVCGICSPHRFKVSGYGNVKVRICNDCYDYILPKTTQPELLGGRSRTESRDSEPEWLLTTDLVYNSTVRDEFTYTHAPSPELLGGRSRTESRDSEPEWLLTTDLVYNSTVRDEFTYTHAPSVALCLSILKLHSEHSSLLRFLFTTIESMLQLLRPISPGTVNPEVDYSLLVTMIRSLLEFSKLSCSQYGSSSDWATVDGLFAEVDLLGMLVASPQTCALLPSEPLRGQSALASLRENLLRSELWTLALEVSTKAGLDYNSVWLAWGKACLKAGAWTDARDKFAHCSPHKKDTQMLPDILQILQDNPQITDLKSRLGRLKGLSTKPDALLTSYSLEPRVYEECLYYLRTYGSHASTLTFYLNQNDIKSAVCMLLETPVETSVYLDSLFLPSLHTARVTQLYTCMSDIDKSLLIFKDYLRASCAYCERHQLYHVLYQAQVWMNDHIRAALTCIHFFRHNTRNYQDLAGHRVHLESALGHLQVTLKQNKDSKSPLVMQLPKSKVVRYISTIRLQMEVIGFLLEVCPEAAPLTLFGPATQRGSLAAIVLTAGPDLEQSFALAGRVADDWHVDKATVVCPAAAQLARVGRIGDILKLVALLETEPKLCNQLLIAALKEKLPQPDIESLIAHITDVPSKITALIECGQLKSAYLLAVKHGRLSDVERIMEAAVQLDQPLIRKICLKRLNLPE